MFAYVGFFLYLCSRFMCKRARTYAHLRAR